MDKLRMESPDMTAQNIDRIAALFPTCITEASDGHGGLKRAINFEMLKQMLSPDVVDGDEAYEFTWVGKKAAIVEANKPIRKTLRPCVAESKDWDTTENLYIEGDNLEVLKLLQESYLGKVKMIYIDPPYNTGNDFIYADDFMRSQEEENEQMGMYDEDENRLFKNTDNNGRFHSDWCSMIYSRLMLARNLLTDDGVIFISIDDNEAKDLASASVIQLKADLRDTGSKMDELALKMKHISTYRQLKPIYDRYKASRDKEKFLRGHESGIILFEAAARECKRLGAVPLPATERMQAEMDELNARKSVLKAELQKTQREERDYAAMRQNVEDFLSPPQPERERKKNVELE